MRKLTIALAALLTASPAFADTLGEAMTAAEDSNPGLAAARARLAASREALPQAWAEALPQIGLSASASRTDRYGAGLENTPRDESWNGSASASQLLFGSGRVLYSTRQARAQIRGAVADYDYSSQALLLEAATAYANVRQAQAVVDASDQTVSNLTTLYQYAQAQFDAGVVTRTDVAQSQARLAQARTQLVQAQGNLSASVEAYMRVIGRPPANLEAPPEAEGLPATLQDALDAAGRDSPALRGAIAATEAADAGVDVAASQGRLRVTLEGSSSIFGDFEEDDLETQSDTVGVRFSIPLVNGGAVRSRTRQQRQLRSAANLDLAYTQRQVQEQVTVAWTSLSSARAAVLSARDQVSAAELAYQGIRLEQETGLRSTIDVLNQEQDLLNARLSLAQAERDLVVAERQVLASLGALKP